MFLLFVKQNNPGASKTTNKDKKEFPRFWMDSRKYSVDMIKDQLVDQGCSSKLHALDNVSSDQKKL